MPFKKSTKPSPTAELALLIAKEHPEYTNQQIAHKVKEIRGLKSTAATFMALSRNDDIKQQIQAARDAIDIDVITAQYPIARHIRMQALQNDDTPAGVKLGHVSDIYRYAHRETPAPEQSINIQHVDEIKILQQGIMMAEQRPQPPDSASDDDMIDITDDMINNKGDK